MLLKELLNLIEKKAELSTLKMMSGSNKVLKALKKAKIGIVRVQETDNKTIVISKDDAKKANDILKNITKKKFK